LTWLDHSSPGWTYKGLVFGFLIARRVAIVLKGTRVRCQQKRQRRIDLPMEVNIGTISGPVKVILFAGRPSSMDHTVGMMPSVVFALYKSRMTASV